LKLIQKKYIGWALVALVISMMIIAPLLFVLEGFADSTNENVVHIRKYLLKDMVWTTIRMILGTCFVALILGVPTAYFVANFKFPLRRILKKANILPAAIPTYIMAFVYASIFSVTGSFTKIAGVFFDRATIFGWGIDVITEGFLMIFLGFALYPYVYSAALVSFSIKNKSMEEAAASLGAGVWKRFFRVVLPLSLGAIMGGAALVAMEVLNDYGAMSYFNVQTMTAGIFQAKQMDFTSSVYLSAVVLAALIGFFAVYFLIRAMKRVEIVESSISYDLRQPSKWNGVLISIVVFFPFFLGFVLPVMELLHLAWGAMDSIASSRFTVVLLNSLQLAFIPALIIVVLALVLLYNDYLNPSKSGALLSSMSTIGYAVPGAVIAVAVISFVLFFDSENKSFYHWGINSLSLLIFAYVIRFLSVGYNTLYGGFERVSRTIPDASRSLGMGSFTTFIKVYFPLLKGAMFTTLAIVVVDVLKELPLTLLLQRFNFDTLATITYENAKINESVTDASPYALLLIFVGVIAILSLVRIDKVK
jgi:iron(III) transport system permease protein